MKKVLILIISIVFVMPPPIRAQQKSMLEQIAALQVYLGWLRKGNNILKDGTNIIGAIKKGDLNLHLSYFDSLKSVNPAVRNSDKVKSVLRMHQAMSDARPLMINKAVNSRQFSAPELKDLRQRCNNLAEASSRDIDELTLVLTPGKASMTDDERIRIIDRLYTGMQRKYTTQKNLNRYVIVLADQRERGKKDAKVLHEVLGK